MTCPHDEISLPTTGDPDTVCAECGEILEPWEVAGVYEGCGESEKKSLKQ